MPSFNEVLNVTSERVLKRPLNDEERREILELAGVLGMKEVQEYLYMILTFKFHEDRLGEKLERMTQVSEHIRDVLQEGTEKILKAAAEDIARNMGRRISEEALKATGALRDYHETRGRILTVSFSGLLMSLGFWLGTFQRGTWSAPGRGIVSALLNLPAGWALLLSMASCSFLWYVDNGEALRRSRKHKILLALQVACSMGVMWMMAQ